MEAVENKYKSFKFHEKIGQKKAVPLTGTFAVATLMIGSTVSKGFSLVSQDSSIPILTPNDTHTNTTNPLANTEEMSAEELDIRLQFAMSVSLVAGVIQVTFKFVVSDCQCIGLSYQRSYSKLKL